MSWAGSCCFFDRSPSNKLLHRHSSGLNVIAVAQGLVVKMGRGHRVSRLHDKPSGDSAKKLCDSEVSGDIGDLPRVRACSKMIVKVLGRAGSGCLLYGAPT